MRRGCEGEGEGEGWGHGCLFSFVLFRSFRVLGAGVIEDSVVSRARVVRGTTGVRRPPALESNYCRTAFSCTTEAFRRSGYDPIWRTGSSSLSI